MWLPLVVAAAFVAIVIGAWAYFGPAGPTYAQGPSTWWWGFFPFGWFVFIPVAFIIFFSLRWFLWGGWGWGWRGGWYQGGYTDPALETLRERFARGEITKEQYEQMRRDLER